MKTIQEARQIIANLAMAEGEMVFAGEVLAGLWDHRNDVQAAMRDDFKARAIEKR